MIKKLHSGKFWLQMVFWSSMVWIVVMSLGYAISVWGLSDERVRRAMQQAMPQGRTIHISQISHKGWLPYPNVVLQNINITHSNSSKTQLYIKQMDVYLSWASLLGRAQIHNLDVLQPQLHIARGQDGSWDIDDFYRDGSGTQALDNLTIVDGLLEVQESKHQYTLTGINAAVQDWQNTHSQLNLSFNWTPEWAGRQHIDLKGQLQKNQTGFKSDNIRIQVDNQLPQIGAVSWLATGRFEHTWLTHRNEFQDIQVKAHNQDQTFTAQFGIPQAHWQKVWQISQANGVMQWQQDADTLTMATIKLNPTELSSQHFKTQSSSIDVLMKKAKDNFSIKASGHISLHNSGAFSFNNWHITSRQSDLQLISGGLFRTEGMLDASGNIHDQWHLNWKGSIDNDEAEMSLRAHTPEKWQLMFNAKQLEWDHYQVWLEKQDEAEANLQNKTISTQKRLLLVDKQVAQGLQTWQRLPDTWELTGQINVGSLRTEQMQLEQVQTQIKLNRDTLTLNDIQAQAYGGQVNANIIIPRHDQEPTQLQMNINQMQIQPWLQHWRDYDRLQGVGNLTLNLQAPGSRPSDMSQDLQGQLDFEIKNGVFRGVALESLWQDGGGNTNMQMKLDEQAQTHFDVFKSHSKIKDGVFHTDVVDLTLPMGLRLQGDGKYQLPNNKLDYQLQFGQQHIKQKLPIRITGGIGQPNIALDYQSLTKGLNNPTDKSEALKNALQKQWQLWQMPEFNLPIKP